MSGNLALPSAVEENCKISGMAASEEIAGMAAEASQTNDGKSYAVSYVVHGAQIACVPPEESDSEQAGEDEGVMMNGTRYRRLIVPLSHGVYLKKKAQLIKTDCVPHDNVQPCGICSVPAPPTEETEPAPKEGFFVKVKKVVKSVAELFFVNKEAKKEELEEVDIAPLCDPVIYGQWEDTKDDVLIDNTPTLLITSFLVCAKGGIIRIVNDGQEDETFG